MGDEFTCWFLKWKLSVKSLVGLVNHVISDLPLQEPRSFTNSTLCSIYTDIWPLAMPLGLALVLLQKT